MYHPSQDSVRGLFFTDSLRKCVLNACILVPFREHAILFIGHSKFKQVGYWEVVQDFFKKFFEVLWGLKNKTFQQLRTLAVASASSSPQTSNPATLGPFQALITHFQSSHSSAQTHIFVLFTQLFLIISHAHSHFPIKLNYISLSRWVCSFIQSLLGAF